MKKKASTDGNIIKKGMLVVHPVGKPSYDEKTSEALPVYHPAITIQRPLKYLIDLNLR